MGMRLRMDNKLFKAIVKLVNKVDSKICLYYVSKMIGEDEDFRENESTKKAVAQILRKVAKKDPKSVSNFLIKLIDVNDETTGLIIKEAMKNLPNKEQDKLKFLIEG